MASTNTKPSYIPTPFANGGQKNTIPVADQGNYLASWTMGFPAVTSTPISEGGLPPDRLDVNGVCNVLSAFIYYLQCGGVFTYDANLASAIGGYAQNIVLAYIDSNNGLTFLRSTKNNNQDNFLTNPAHIGTSWVKDIPTFSDLTTRVPASVGSVTNPVYTDSNGIITPCTPDFFMGRPNYNSAVVLPANTRTYTAPSNGYITFTAEGYNNTAYAYVDNVLVYQSNSQQACSNTFPIAKNSVFTRNGGSSIIQITFVPCG